MLPPPQPSKSLEASVKNPYIYKRLRTRPPWDKNNIYLEYDNEEQSDADQMPIKLIRVSLSVSEIFVPEKNYLRFTITPKPVADSAKLHEIEKKLTKKGHMPLGFANENWGQPVHER